MVDAILLVLLVTAVHLRLVRLHPYFLDRVLRGQSELVTWNPILPLELPSIRASLMVVVVWMAEVGMD